MKEYETWSIGNGEINIYTLNPSVAGVLKKLFGRLTTYERNGKVFAWQCRISNTKLKFVEMEIMKILGNKNQQVTATREAKFQFIDRNPIRVVYSDSHVMEAVHHENEYGEKRPD